MLINTAEFCSHNFINFHVLTDDVFHSIKTLFFVPITGRSKPEFKVHNITITILQALTSDSLKEDIFVHFNIQLSMTLSIFKHMLQYLPSLGTARSPLVEKVTHSTVGNYQEKSRVHYTI
jgi:hypothetical protein